MKMLYLAKFANAVIVINFLICQCYFHLCFVLVVVLKYAQVLTKELVIPEDWKEKILI